MGGSSANHRVTFARDQKHQSKHFTTGVFSGHDRSIIPSTPNNDSRTDRVPSADEARALSVLARVFDSSFGQTSWDVAKELIDRHGSLSNVLDAVERSVGSPENEAHSIIRAANRLVEAGLCEKISSSKVDPYDPSLLRFLRLNFRRANSEQLQSVFLDNGMRFICHEVIATGDESKLVINSSRLFKRCIDLGASAIILAHNHPSGNASPSEADRKGTEQLQRMAHCLGIEISDHIIFAAGKAFSMKKGGML